MTLTVNGDQLDVESGVSVADLLKSMSIRTQHVAVEVNREIVSRDRYAGHALQDGDQLEVVTLTGGG